MKKYISLLICFTALVSCSDWLDVKPSTQKDREDLFSSEKGYSEAIKGVYSQMSASSLYGRQLTWGIIDAFGGVYRTSGSTLYTSARKYGYIKEDATSFSVDVLSTVEKFWSGLYNAAAGVNSILDEIDESKDVFSGDNYSVIKGEAIGLRAFLHFEILRLFGDVYEKCKDKNVMPYVNELTSKVTSELDGNQIYEIIITELKEAIALLENDPMHLGTKPSAILASEPSGLSQETNNVLPWHNRRFHFNYYAAKATLARVYLWKGDATSKNLALQIALELIADQKTRFPWVLPLNLSNIANETASLQDRTFATEHIFALNIDILEDLIAGYHNNKVALGTGKMFINVDVFPTNERGVDPRIWRLTYPESTTNFLPTKYYQPERVYPYLRDRMPMIRITEMYLIAAECAPNWQDGIQYINAIRTQRGISALTITSQSELQTAIYNEYRKEFWGEGQMWHYYKRLQYATIPSHP